ncbi:MAG: polysaccharide biosynthesis protein, partial [Gammaproteobacteria bacterium]|nr:polysaccharide biosynthesis protein [Gammaproteobacteria bacterium]
MKINLNWLKSRFIVFAHDVCMIPLAWLGAYWLRFNLGEIPQIHLKTAIA